MEINFWGKWIKLQDNIRILVNLNCYRLPDELGHIVHLAVLNLAGNFIPHLPVSFVKFKSITAIWLANNQTKPLVQLNHDTDPYTGQKVLTNFLLPQQVVYISQLLIRLIYMFQIVLNTIRNVINFLLA